MSKTASMGDISINAEGLSTEMCIETLNAVHRLRREEDARRLIESISHGHRFDEVFRCACGLQKREYLFDENNRTMCPIVVAHIKEHRRIPGWLSHNLPPERINT